jgi:hypothetical protein
MSMIWKIAAEFIAIALIGANCAAAQPYEHQTHRLKQHVTHTSGRVGEMDPKTGAIDTSNAGSTDGLGTRSGQRRAAEQQPPISKSK